MKRRPNCNINFLVNFNGGDTSKPLISHHPAPGLIAEWIDIPQKRLQKKLSHNLPQEDQRKNGLKRQNGL